jgi:hypothetical protein
MNKNQLKTLNEKQFEKNLKLEKIQLQKNKISILSEKIFDGLEKLKEVDLRGNLCVDRQFGFWLGKGKFLEAFGEVFKAEMSKNCSGNNFNLKTLNF